MSRLYLALVHHPVRDRAGQTVTTAVTNLDVHDVARSARTYDLAGAFLVTPIEAQRKLVERILSHWGEGGVGTRRVPERARALSIWTVVESLADARRAIEAEVGVAPRVWVTSAQPVAEATPVGWDGLASSDEPTLVVFGTGHGLANEVLAAADGALPPIRAGRDFRHLSVRAAVAIALDRLVGD